MNELDKFINLLVDKLDVEIKAADTATRSGTGFASLIDVSKLSALMTVRNAIVLSHNEVYNSRNEGK